MPMVELVAKKTLELNPDIGLDVVDLIVLLWLYTNPHSTSRRQLSSIKYVLRMTEELQSPDGTLPITDDELTQLVLASLRRLKEKNLLYLRSAGVHFIKGTLTQAGLDLINASVKRPYLRRVTHEFGDSP